MQETNEEGAKIRSRSAALMAVLISIGAVMGQLTIGPALNLTKTAKPTMIHEGENVTYTFFVNNTGDAEITAINITDSDLGFVAGPFSLLPEANRTVEVNHTVFSDTLNNATATGFDPEGKKVNHTATAFVDVIHPNLTLTKTVNSTMIYRNQAVNYTFFINNTGDVHIAAINVTDDHLGMIVGPFGLAPGQNLTVNRIVSVENDILNNATVAGLDPLGANVTVNATAFVDVIHPNLTLTKMAKPTMIYVGDEVNYTYVVNNTGDVDLSAVDITDDALGHIAGPFDLSAGTWLSFEVKVSVENDTLNNATAVGIDPLRGMVDANATAFVDVIHPELTLVKSVDPKTASSGEEVTYTFYIENTGDVNVTAINVTDDHLGHIAGPFNLTPTQSLTTNVKATMYATTFNTATAVGFDPLGNLVHANDTAAMRVLTLSEMRSMGFWKHQFSEKGHKHLTREALMAYLALIPDESGIFEEIFQLSYGNATSYLWIGKASMLNRSVQQCLACWLNWANGAVGMGDMVDTNWDGQPDMTFSDAMALVEDLIANGDDKQDYEKAKDICDSINNMGESDDDEEDEEENDEEDEEQNDEEDDQEQEPAEGRGPPENNGEPQGRGPPEDKTPPVKRGPPEDTDEPQGRGPPEENQKAKSAKK